MNLVHPPTSNPGSTPATCALKKASLLFSPGGPLSRPRHAPSSFVASVNKEVRHVIALWPDVETSLKTLGQ